MTLEEKYKDKIDWKFFNYLVDKATPFEDAGNTINIIVCLNFDNLNAIYLYTYINGVLSWNNDTVYKYETMLKDLYEKTMDDGNLEYMVATIDSSKGCFKEYSSIILKNSIYVSTHSEYSISVLPKHQ